MKIFGGGASRSDHKGAAQRVPAAKSRTAQTVAPRSAQARVPAEAAGKKRTAPYQSGQSAGAVRSKTGKAGKTISKQSKRKRGIMVFCTVLAVLTAFACMGVIAAYFWIQPPQMKPNDPTIKDPENGDKVDVSVNQMLNAGQRVDDVFTFVVGGLDEDQTRTDALMVATMDTRRLSLNVMNIPRDTMCNTNASGASRKINAAYALGGIERTKDEVEKIMGFRPDKYIIMNFEGIAAIVDAIGGVEYEVPFRMLYDDPSQNLHIDLYAGLQHLDGKQVVHFLRWRQNNGYRGGYVNGDEGRVETQQKFLKYLAGEVFQLKNITKIKDIANAVFQNVKTDLTAGQILWMGMQAMQIKNENVNFFTLPGYAAMSTAGTSTAYSFFFPYQNKTLELVNQSFNPYTSPISSLNIASGPSSAAVSSNYNYNNYDNDSYSYNQSYYDNSTSGDSEPTGSTNTNASSSSSSSSSGNDTTTPDDTIDHDPEMGSGTPPTETDAPDTQEGNAHDPEVNEGATQEPTPEQPVTPEQPAAPEPAPPSPPADEPTTPNEPTTELPAVGDPEA